MKKSMFLIVSFLFMIHSVFATSIAAPETASPAGATSMIIIFVLGILIVLMLALIIFLYDLNGALAVIYANTGNKEEKKLFDLTGAVPIDREYEIMMDHEYDGIRELDNNLPTWWKYMFYATIVFAVVYFYYYQTSGYGDTQIQEYDKSMIAAAADEKLQVSKVDENSVTLLTEATDIEEGKALFIENCAVCHGNLGEGKSGPNFTDEYWLHGGDIKSVFKTIKYGVTEKGMISWKTQISAEQIQQVASYVLTLKGTNPPNAKEPQGELVK